jgi:hypothetical protein
MPAVGTPGRGKRQRQQQGWGRQLLQRLGRHLLRQGWGKHLRLRQGRSKRQCQ